MPSSPNGIGEPVCDAAGYAWSLARYSRHIIAVHTICTLLDSGDFDRHGGVSRPFRTRSDARPFTRGSRFHIPAASRHPQA
ncbi:uncharacterized protein BXZ73DRAFT_103236 [Epithele typhae]|uniref:uncharacterized protein n=1 Tax=Epithele typhae TaxID=378194 RepID=UPI0020072431|nr:uncharacterized protein BXZ73DRAFT_103236 [Epithele typhae]KAH9925349.1 hypothetical protein BXZ73DRAFT_103236 [Epithele typhae]